ncbi:hypothetical protein C489_02451 [Natrinema versiforme JCM 10478]|uniref:Uncharacterized protein n=1 Tax=Natrinema versiforme JCM 10478 TaxID=1227496 RepID=L9Y9V5_9EURY|nr:hypothetical protein C489_02451 [Natrinema versiforme JCM 10478]
MAIFSESRRGFVARVTGTGVLGSLAGCAAVGTGRADIIIENTGTREERTEYYIDRAETTTETRTIDLEPGDEQTASVELERGDVVVISKGELGFECTFNGSLCREPTLQVDTGFAALGIGGECFDISPQ